MTLPLPPLGLLGAAASVASTWAYLASARPPFADPRVPMGALGYRMVPTERAGARPKPPLPDRWAVTWVWVAKGASADAPRLSAPRTERILGGAAVGRQAAEIVRRAARRGEAGLALIREEDRKAAYFERFEVAADEQLKDALSLNVRPFVGESDDEYDERLTRLYRNFRARVDGWGPSLVGSPPARDARPTDVRQTDPVRPTLPEVVARARSALPIVLTHGEKRALRRRFWRKFRRWPTDAEFADLAAAEKGRAAG